MVYSCKTPCDNIYGNIEEKHSEKECLKERAISTTKNISLQSINKTVYTKLLDEVTTFPNADRTYSDETVREDSQNPIEMLNTLIAGSALPAHNPTLKIEFPVMLLRNLALFGGHVSSARYIVKAVRPNFLELESLTVDNAGKILALPKMPCCPVDINFPMQLFTRIQFPVRVDFTTTLITLNKAQGRSFCDAVGYDPSHTKFLQVHLYAGLSRVTHHEKLRLCMPPDSD